MSNLEQPITKLVDSLPVSGYKPQSLTNIDLVNRNKLLEELVLRVYDELTNNPHIDRRWLAIGRTALENSFMAMNRAIFSPTRINLPFNEKLLVQNLEVILSQQFDEQQ